MKHSGKAQILRNSSIFSSLNDDELTELAGLAIERSFTADEFVFWDGDAPEWFYIVAEGKVKVVKHSSLGKEFVIAFFGPGEMFGEVAVFENKPYPASAQAVTETKVVGIKREDFLSWQRTEAVKTLLSWINSWVKLSLLMLTAIVGGSEVIWNTVLATCPLSLFPLLEHTTYRP